MNGAAFARKTPMISPACKTCSAYSIYCEYDPLTDTIYPNDPDQCLILKEENTNETP